MAKCDTKLHILFPWDPETGILPCYSTFDMRLKYFRGVKLKGQCSSDPLGQEVNFKSRTRVSYLCLI